MRWGKKIAQHLWFETPHFTRRSSCSCFPDAGRNSSLYFLSLSVLVVFSIPRTLRAQEVYGGLMPEFGITLPIKGNFSQTYKIENQHLLLRDGTEENGFVYEYERTDLQAFLNYRFSGNWKATVGYQLRIEQQWNTHHRTILQAATSTRIRNLRLAHRVRSDQTMERDEPFVFRLRYRAALEIPLSGDKIDPKEFYVVVSDEPIYSIDSERTNGFENRFVVTVGHFFSNKNKLELSLDHRTDRFFDTDIRQRIWLKIGWFLNISEL